MQNILSASIKQVKTGIVPSVSRGFTLLELLIVIAILAILAAVVIIVLNPAQTLMQARDSQRLSDLSTLKSSIALYLTTQSSPSLDNGVVDNSTSAPHCFGSLAIPSSSIWYSKETAISDTTRPATVGADIGNSGQWARNNYNDTATACGNFCAIWVNTSAAQNGNYADANVSKIDGTGWLPVKLSDVTGGSPLSNLPLDPTNSLTAASPVATAGTGDFVYRYGCVDAITGTGKPSNVFEINAVLESNKYTNSTLDDLDGKDGGDNANTYEVGTSVRILPTGNDF